MSDISTRRLLCGLCLFASLACGCARRSDRNGATRSTKRYRFSLNGAPFKPHIIPVNGASGDPAPGDLVAVRVSSLPGWSTFSTPPVLEFLLGDEKEYDFRTSPTNKGLLYLKSSTREFQPVGAWVFKSDSQVVNPLKDLMPKQLAALKGIILMEAPDGLRDQLGQVVSSACIKIVTDTIKKLPTLPVPTRCLLFDNRYGNRLDLTSLGELSSLRILRVPILNPSFDLALIGRNTQLQYLDLRLNSLRSIDILQRFRALRHLSLEQSIVEGSTSFDLRCLSSLEQLETLNISSTHTRDLKTVSHLRRLREIFANFTQITELPSRSWPSLQSLQVLATPIPDNQYHRFVKEHPKVDVPRRWVDPLKKLVAGTDFIRVRTGGLILRRTDSDGEGSILLKKHREGTLLEIQDRRRISQFVSTLDVTEPWRGGGAFVPDSGNPTIEFYQDNWLIASVSLGWWNLGPDPGLNWTRWPGPAPLTKKSANALLNLLGSVRRVVSFHRVLEAVKGNDPEETYLKLNGSTFYTLEKASQVNIVDSVAGQEKDVVIVKVDYDREPTPCDHCYYVAEVDRTNVSLSVTPDVLGPYCHYGDYLSAKRDGSDLHLSFTAHGAIHIYSYGRERLRKVLASTARTKPKERLCKKFFQEYMRCVRGKDCSFCESDWEEKHLPALAELGCNACKYISGSKRICETRWYFFGLSEKDFCRRFCSD